MPNLNVSSENRKFNVRLTGVCFSKHRLNNCFLDNGRDTDWEDFIDKQTYQCSNSNN